MEMGDEMATAGARATFLRTSGLGRKSVRTLFGYLGAFEGLHRTEELARQHHVSSPTILRRLRILKRYGLVRQTKGEGRADAGTVGGREQDMWQAADGETLDAVAGRFVEGVTMGEALARKAAQ